MRITSTRSRRGGTPSSSFSLGRTTVLLRIVLIGSLVALLVWLCLFSSRIAAAAVDDGDGVLDHPGVFVDSYADDFKNVLHVRVGSSSSSTSTSTSTITGEKKKKKPTSYQLEDLEQVALPHGTFFWGPHSQEIEIPKEHDLQQQAPRPFLENKYYHYQHAGEWNPQQKALLDDEEIDIEKEKQRCARYKYKYDGRRTSRRRLFGGVRITDDSILQVLVAGTEAWNVFHTVAYIEFTETQNLSPRRLRFNESSEDLFLLMQSHGPKTRVSMDYYTTNATKTFGHGGIGQENLQFESLTLRWKRNGMRPDDIGIIVDADEMFTRDFLRAMQICDIPQFRPGQNCKAGKILGSTLVFEGSPECLAKDRRWYHPDAILGECVDRIGNETLHPPAKREYLENHSHRLPGYGRFNEYHNYKPNPTGDENGVFPLWQAADIRLESGGNMVSQESGGHTGYHFHNQFESTEQIHYKYLTYGHDIPDAMEKPMWEFHEDIEMGVDCIRKNSSSDKTISFNDIPSGHMRPIYYMNDEARNARHQKWIEIVRDEEKWWAQKLKEKNET